MNLAVIFAGGAGVRMNTKSRPKQFLEHAGKPIIIYTLEVFDNHKEIDAIVVVCIAPWIPFLKKMLRKFEINKVVKITEGGATGQDSIYQGLKAAKTYAEKQSSVEEPVVLIHDGVRPLILPETITDNINSVRKFGSGITTVPTIETFIVRKEGGHLEIPDRKDSFIARAPQSFYLKDICEAHDKARSENKTDFIDSCSMMNHYGYPIHTVVGPMENIKITTPSDFFIFKAMIEVRENQQIYGF